MEAVERVFEAINRAFGISEDEIRHKTKERDVVIPRQVAMHYLRRNTRMTLHQIARKFNRDHSTVIHSFKEVEKHISSGDQKATRAYLKLLQALNDLNCNPCTTFIDLNLKAAA